MFKLNYIESPNSYITFLGLIWPLRGYIEKGENVTLGQVNLVPNSLDNHDGLITNYFTTYQQPTSKL